MLIDARGMAHPDHIREFRERIGNVCTVNEEVDVLMDDSPELQKRFEMFIRSCRANYTVEREEGFLRVRIKAPFCMCG